MASKLVVRASALAVMLALGTGAYWYQTKPASKAAEGMATPASPAGGAPAAGPGAGRPGGGKPAVEVAKVEVIRIVDDTQAVGSLRSRQGVVIKPEISGRITQLNFRDGDRVRKGQVLVQLDDQLPAAQIKQAEAELSIAQSNFNRNRELVEQNFISRRTVDESSANLQVAEAKLALAKATAARLRILAPFDGTVGIRQANIGDYLKDGAEVVNLEDIDAVFVDYRLPERFQAKVRRGQMAEIDVDALPGRKFQAVVQAIDPLIDANGRSLGVRACIDNRRMLLRPGMFARVNTVFGARASAKVVPEEAIVPQGGRQFVIKLVDGPEGKVTQRVEVKLGLRSPGKVEVLEGLEADDTVVVAGQQRVQKDGTSVRVLEIGRGGGPGGAGGPGASPAPGTPGGPGGSGVAGAPAATGAAGAQGTPVTAKALAPSAPVNAPALQGPNPCLASMAQAGRADTRAPAIPAPAAAPAARPGAGLAPA
jgi:membrane fusion protein (multidrug efflux system)